MNKVPHLCMFVGVVFLATTAIQLSGQDNRVGNPDNSGKTLEDVAAHYTLFFAIVTGGGLILTEQDQADMVAFMKLL